MADDKEAHLPPPQCPTPTLTYDFHIECDLNPRISVGEGPWGQRNWISFTGGTWSAAWGHGTIEPGGQDSQLVLPTLSTSISTQYLLRTADPSPAFIAVHTSGWRTGPRSVLEALADPERADGVDPASYSFRLYVTLETGDERYSGVCNTGMWVGSGVRRGARVIYDAYRIG